MTDTNYRPADGTDRKAVLFCPVCGHRGPYDGAWSVDRGADGGRTEVECPDCGELVVSQPRFDTGEKTGPFGLVRPLLQFVNAVVRHDVV